MADFLSFAGKLNDISVFNEGTFNKVINEESGAYKIKIEAEGSRTLSKDDEGVYVLGVIRGGIQLRTSTNWGELELDSALGALASNIPLVNEIKDAANIVSTVGGVKLQTDLQSKKFYSGGSYMSLPLSLKVLDDDNTGKAIKAVLTLFALSMPRNKWSLKLKDSVNKLIEMLPKNEQDKVKEELGKLNNKVTNGLNYVKSVGSKVVSDNGIKFFEGVGDVFQRGFNEIVDEEMRLTESPPTVKISVGNWLILENMVIDSVNASFSEQSSEVGPQSVEIDLEVSSRNKLFLDDNGIINGKGRVRIVNKGSNVKVNNSGTFA